MLVGHDANQALKQPTESGDAGHPKIYFGILGHSSKKALRADHNILRYNYCVSIVGCMTTTTCFPHTKLASMHFCSDSEATLQNIPVAIVVCSPHVTFHVSQQFQVLIWRATVESE